MTVSPRVPLPTVRGRQTQAAIDAAAHAAIAHKGILAAAISDIAAGPGLSDWERSYQAAAAHWHSYFAEYLADICALPLPLITEIVKHVQRQGLCYENDPHLIAVSVDDACVATLATVFYRIYHRAAA